MTKARIFALGIIALASCASGATVGVTSKAPSPSATPTTVASAKPTPIPGMSTDVIDLQHQVNDLANALVVACYKMKPTKEAKLLVACAQSYVDAVHKANAMRAAKAAPSPSYSPTPTPKPHLPVE